MKSFYGKNTESNWTLLKAKNSTQAKKETTKIFGGSFEDHLLYVRQATKEQVNSGEISIIKGYCRKIKTGSKWIEES